MGPVASFSVANINPGVVRAEFMRSVMGLVEHERFQARSSMMPRVRFDQFLDRFAGPYLDDERNHCVAWFFLDSTMSDFLVFQDSDVVPPAPEAYFELVSSAVEHDARVVSGVYFSAYPEGVRPVLYQWEGEGDHAASVLLTRKALGEFRASSPSALMPIDACGAGFLAIHRSVLKQIGERFGTPTPWFAEVSLNGVHLGEDMTFCVRAAHVGVQPYANVDVVVDHYKTCCIRGEELSDGVR